MRGALPRLLFAAAALPFLPALFARFVDWDDPVFIVKNELLKGFDLPAMFFFVYGGHYHPLSWLSMKLDRVIFGPGPFGPHLINILLHAASAVVLLQVARRLLGDDEDAVWPAAFAALLFAVHPLRAESVAWATERRDCLSGLFYLLTIRCWLEDRAQPALAWFVVSLLSKGIGVTLPLALALIDTACRGRRLDAAWAKKVAPFAAAALVFGVVGLRAQRGNGANLTLAAFSLSSRAAVAAYGLCFYPFKTLLPVSLIPLYPLPKPLPTLSQYPYGPCAALVAALTVFLWHQRRRYPRVAAGALFYAATVGPVVGVFHFGPQLVADRYSYLPCLPLALFGGAALRRGLADPARRRLAAAAAGALVVALAGLTVRQVAFWHDGVTLWERELSVRRDVPLAHHYLAEIALSHGNTAEAERRERDALAVDRAYAPALNGLGLALSAQGRAAEADAAYRAALAAKPDYWEPASNLGLSLARQHRFEEASLSFQRALHLEPANAGVHANFGLALLTAGDRARGAAELETALRLDPNQPKIAAIRASLNNGVRPRN